MAAAREREKGRPLMAAVRERGEDCMTLQCLLCMQSSTASICYGSSWHTSK